MDCFWHLTTVLENNSIKFVTTSFFLQTDDFPNCYMANGNFTQVTEFILTGVSERPDLQIPLFFVFLVIYGLTVTGNLSIITLTSVDSHLQTPMYFFLWHLAIINLGNSTVIAPKMLINFLVKKTHHLLLWMCHPTGSILGFHCSWVAHVSRDGLWLLCGHLSPPALHGGGVSADLLSASFPHIPL